MGELNPDRVDAMSTTVPKPSAVSVAFDWIESVSSRFNAANGSQLAFAAVQTAAGAAYAAGDHATMELKYLVGQELLNVTRGFLEEAVERLASPPKGYEQTATFFRDAVECFLGVLAEFANPDADNSARVVEQLTERGIARLSTAMNLACERLLGEESRGVDDTTKQRGFRMFVAQMFGLST